MRLVQHYLHLSRENPVIPHLLLASVCIHTHTYSPNIPQPWRVCDSDVIIILLSGGHVSEHMPTQPHLTPELQKYTTINTKHKQFLIVIKTLNRLQIGTICRDKVVIRIIHPASVRPRVCRMMASDGWWPGGDVRSNAPSTGRMHHSVPVPTLSCVICVVTL